MLCCLYVTKACYAATLPAWWHTQKTMIHPVCIKIIDDCRSTSSPSACTRRRSCWSHVATGSSATCCLIRPPSHSVVEPSAKPSCIFPPAFAAGTAEVQAVPQRTMSEGICETRTLRRLERLILRIPSATDWPSCNSETRTKHFLHTAWKELKPVSSYQRRRWACSRLFELCTHVGLAASAASCRIICRLVS